MDKIEQALEKVEDFLDDQNWSPLMSEAREALTTLRAELAGMKAVVEAAEGLMVYRVLPYPLRGDLRDNDASRAQIDALATALDRARSATHPEQTP